MPQWRAQFAPAQPVDKLEAADGMSAALRNSGVFGTSLGQLYSNLHCFSV